ncbi:FmdB family transcriptional regulator [Kocuria tytonicola]|uniref:FmdB family transcriptional regulator n=1 Tax=Kocuria tytonicola TaxID=2055946 RepID=A0A3L9M034_9MICC|nr:FmdB family zinc ribbon protein [Kocuria tytonicola]RLY94460.1 FmdB family transcriptional regulator [Kocuria tytonicola]RLZ04509.1 FmdB family transcriptional regulator [Kocuria tytonicola]
MPVYAYACKDCGHAFDIRQSFSDDALTVCPECGGQLRKKFNSVGVVFKGSGFYRTDSRSASGAGSSGSDDSGSGSAGTSSTPSSGTGKDSGSADSSSGSGTPSSSGTGAGKAGTSTSQDS